MGPLKQREERRKVFLHARMRTDYGWTDVTIENVSSRGLLLQSASPLERNCFIEVRYAHLCIVGRVMWTQRAKFGVRTQDAIDVASLCCQVPPKPRQAGEERRAVPRGRQPPGGKVAEVSETSRRSARLFDWTLVAVAAGATSAFMAQTAWAALNAPMAQVTAVLSHAN